RPSRRPDRALRDPRLRVPPRRRAAHELPSSALDAPRARHGLRRRRGDPRALCGGDSRALPLLLLRRRHARAVSYEVTATAGEARAGVLRTAHGDVPTPAFMPVGTKGTVKTLAPVEPRELGPTILLGNTYHLRLRHGDRGVPELGG